MSDGERHSVTRSEAPSAPRLASSRSCALRSLAVVLFLVLGCATPLGQDRPIEGEYYWGAEVNSFRPCEGEDHYWVVAGDLQAELTTAIETRTGAAYEPLLIVVRGAPRAFGPTDDGFALQYDGIFDVSEILEISDSKATCPDRRKP